MTLKNWWIFDRKWWQFHSYRSQATAGFALLLIDISEGQILVPMLHMKITTDTGKISQTFLWHKIIATHLFLRVYCTAFLIALGKNQRFLLGFWELFGQDSIGSDQITCQDQYVLRFLIILWSNCQFSSRKSNLNLLIGFRQILKFFCWFSSDLA